MRLPKTINPTSYNDTRLSAALPNFFFGGEGGGGTSRENTVIPVHTTNFTVFFFGTLEFEPGVGKGDS